MLQKSFLISTLLLLLVSCHVTNEEPLIIWTDSPQLASYVELFNATHAGVKAVALYKAFPSEALAFEAKNAENRPDILIGSYLKNDRTHASYSSLNGLFKTDFLNKEDYYPQLLDYGAMNKKQYLIPISFNIGAVMVSGQNEKLLENPYFISLDEIREKSFSFNKIENSSEFSIMSFAPSWSEAFIYEATRLKGVNYRQNGQDFSYDKEELQDCIDYMINWTARYNKDTETEQNFAFKYLYMPEYKQVSSGRCLFAYTTSEEFLALDAEQQEGISYRWLKEGDNVYIEDDIITLGLYKHSKHKKEAKIFILWFCSQETQKQLLQKSKEINVNNKSFGILGGFSAIVDVNKTVFPVYYHSLLSNMPPEDYITPVQMLPSRWNDIKENVILPYLKEATAYDEEDNERAIIKSLEDRENDWHQIVY